MPDAHLLIGLYERNAPERCGSLRSAYKMEEVFLSAQQIGIGLTVISNPFLCPGKQCFGHQIEIYYSAIFQIQKGFDNDPFIGRYNLEQIFLMADIVSRLLENNCLYNERGRFI